MKLFITGVGGFVGSFVMNWLVERGHDVIGASRTGVVKHDFRASTKKYEIVSSDLARIQELPAGVTDIVHIAASTQAPGRSMKVFLEDNAEATRRLTELAVAHRVKRFIYCSSVSIYGDVNDPIISEKTPRTNADPYGISKYIGEVFLRERSEELNSLSLRLPAVLGKGARNHWIASLREKALNHSEITVFNPDAHFNNAVAVWNLAEFIEQLLQQSWVGADAVTLGSNGGCSVQEVARHIVTTLRSRSNIKVATATKTPFSISSEYAMKTYGYKPDDFMEMLTRYLESGGK